MEQFRGTEICGAVRVEEPTTGRPTPVTLDELAGFFDSLSSAAVTDKYTLDKLVKSYAALTKTFATLIDTNSCITNKVEALPNELKDKKNGSGGGGAELSNGK